MDSDDDSRQSYDYNSDTSNISHSSSLDGSKGAKSKRKRDPPTFEENKSNRSRAFKKQQQNFPEKLNYYNAKYGSSYLVFSFLPERREGMVSFTNGELKDLFMKPLREFTSEMQQSSQDEPLINVLENYIKNTIGGRKPEKRKRKAKVDDMQPSIVHFIRPEQNAANLEVIKRDLIEEKKREERNAQRKKERPKKKKVAETIDSELLPVRIAATLMEGSDVYINNRQIHDTQIFTDPDQEPNENDYF
jgi:hypothetical protein